MGIRQSFGNVDEVNEEDLETLFSFPEGVDKRSELIGKYKPSALCKYSIFSNDDEDRDKIKLILKEGTNDKKLDKAMGCIYGMVIGDALGAPLEFSSVRYGSNELKGMDQLEIWNKEGYNRFKLKPGQWTDDASMGFCLADSLLCCEGFNAFDLRLRFLNWWQLGYCNAFGKDQPVRSSVGLGGNISGSMTEFCNEKTEYTTAGNKETSGNGSIMRMCAVPIYFHKQKEKAIDFSYKQSKTTHQGDEAAECCKLMAHVIVDCIENSDSTKVTFYKSIESFKTKVYSLQCLSQSKNEEAHDDNSHLNLEDRKWKWKEDEYKYCKSRAEKQPGYIGSYAMDGLAMALHCIHTTNSFSEALLKAANMRGDADTVCAITGQIAGAIYGLKNIPKDWIQLVNKWDGDSIALRGFKLFHNKKINK